MKKIRETFNLSLLFALLLTFVGGFLELYSLKVHGVFAGMQTGNLITMFTALVDGKTTRALFRLAVIGVFFLGCFLSEMIRLFLKKRKRRWEPVILVGEIVFLLPLFFLPAKGRDIIAEMAEPTGIDIVADIFLALFSSFQYASFRTVNGTSYASTMMTNLLTSIAKDLALLSSKKDEDAALRLLEHGLILVFFIAGFLVFYLSLLFLNGGSDLSLRLILFIPIIILVFLFILSLSLSKKEEKTRL